MAVYMCHFARSCVLVTDQSAGLLKIFLPVLATLFARVASSMALAEGCESGGGSYASASTANWSGLYIGRPMAVVPQDEEKRSATVSCDGGDDC